ncbi:MAG: HAD-IA family hydrolase [Candidatus Aenigmarchaeota archaeon]|nr:HAD-IA family hydrolase [Candidatus Aenigmarchaeota archaeon]
MIKAIMFDLDNTLIDFVRMKKLSCEAAIDAMIDNGLKISKKKALKIMFDLYNKYGWEYQRIFQLFMKKVIKKIDYRIMCSGIVAYRKIKEGLLYPYPNVSSTLDRLKKKGYKLVILTDAPRIQAWIRLAAMGIQNKFDYVITFDDTRKKKIDEKPFLFALKKLKLKPEEVIMVGDSIKRDLKIPKKLGITTVLAKYGQLEKEKGKVDYEINDISELLKIVKKL